MSRTSAVLQVLTGEPAFVGLGYWLLLLIHFQRTFSNV